MEKKELKGHLILLMAPSGSGKKSVFDAVLANHRDIYFAKTFTSRKIRQGVEENPLYMFISEEEFLKMIDEKAFVEWANYSGNYYGTSIADVMKPLEEGKIVFKEMELQGVQQMKKVVPEEHRTIIYIDGGEWSCLERRILDRAPISSEELEMRRQRYEEECKAMPAADVVITNHDGQLTEAQQQVEAVMQDVIKRTTNT